MKRLGFLLFCLGIVGAILCAAKMPAEGQEWSDMLVYFGAAIALGIVGLVLWRRGVSQEAQAAAKATGDSANPVTLLSGLPEPLAALSGDIEQLDASQLTERVDDLLNRFVLPFAEVRQTLIDRMGMEKGADVLVTVAFGERMLNRVWSAAADGHLPEARASFVDAHDALLEAASLVQDA